MVVGSPILPFGTPLYHIFVMSNTEFDGEKMCSTYELAPRHILTHVWVGGGACRVALGGVSRIHPHT